jgi:hypothetical protein
MIAAILLSTALAASPVPPPPGGVAPRPVARTSVGKDLDVSEPVEGNVVAILSNVRVNAPVSGNVIVWGGDAVIGPSGTIRGNLSVFGGQISGPPGRALAVAGAVSTPGSLLRLYLDEMHRAPWEEANRVPAMRGLRIMALSLWLFVSLLLLYAFGSPFARAAAATDEDWTSSLLAGALGVLTLFLAAAAALALLPASLSIPIALAFGALAVAAKIFGMAALFLLVGQKLLRNVSPVKRPAALAAGFTLLAGISLLPFVGALVWSIASIAAVGIALSSRFGSPRLRVALAR